MNESLGRYLTEKTYFSVVKNAVLPKAFMPPPNLKLSVFRIDGLGLKQIWEMGQTQVLATMPKSVAATKRINGIADIKVSKVQRLSLNVQPTGSPSRHANICGWPEEKERQKSIAQELAAEAALKLKQI
jgi:hypothetical protein